MLQVFRQEGLDSFVVEADRNGTVTLDPKVSTVIVTEGQFSVVDTEERKFKLLATRPKSAKPMTLVGDCEKNRAVVFVDKPDDTTEEESEKRGRFENEDFVPNMPIVSTPRPGIVNLFTKYGEQVLAICHRLLLDKDIIIRYGSSELQAHVVGVTLKENIRHVRDKSYINVTVTYKVENVQFTTDHATFAAQFRSMIKEVYPQSAISFWQRTFMGTSALMGASLDQLIPIDVRRFSLDSAIQTFLSLNH